MSPRIPRVLRVVLVALLMVVLGRTAESRADSEPAKAEAVPVPQGFRGLRFGMSPEQVKKALPDAMEWKVLPKGSFYDEDPIFGHREVDLPFLRFSAFVTVGELPAQCKFEFVGGARLGRMVCTLFPPEGTDACRAAERPLLEILRKKYGEPTYLKPPDQVPWECRWKDAGATLNLEARCTQGDRQGRFIITNVSAEYERELQRFKDWLRNDNERKARILRAKPRRYDRDL